MLVRWLRQNECEELVFLGLSEGWIISLDEVQKTQKRFPHLCFGAQVDDKLVGGLTSYLHEKSAWIGNFVVEREHRGQGIGRALFECALNALQNDRQSIYLHAAPAAVKLYEGFGFKPTREVVRYSFASSGSVPQEKSFLKELTSDTVSGTMRHFDTQIFGEDRAELLEDIYTKSSLLLSCENGFCHSKAVGSCLVIAPWEMKSGAYMDAEKILRTILSVRGQKTIYADVPSDVADTSQMYLSYGFSEVGRTVQMCYGESLALRYENIYAFGSLGSKA